ncbi:neuropeptide CCHamide-2 isoform X1 [Lycorma delicatula]|uniref:neuropeptide CCHamide-2 isoform X1 n=1 Tax=Lycorma delicatula TaxID=130591 RepID=UPI003F50DC6C
MSFLIKSTTTSTTMLLLCLLLIAAALADIASAKRRLINTRKVSRGCSAFGHSCFGGHGKRADEEFFPQTDYDSAVPSSADAGSVDNNMMEKPHRATTSVLAPDIVPLLRQWLMSYRRSSGSGFK